MHPFTLYRAMRTVNPSPFMFYLQMGEEQIVGASPEALIRLDGRELTTHPIAGTRRRGRSEAEDLALEAELLADEKERAEHIMLVDLGRNDIGRVCEYGSVHVDELMVIEKYSHVQHIVSNVVGTLSPGKNAYDVLRATFPAGTLSGAPKIRAMEIIHELEAEKRGLVYAGAAGYISCEGQVDVCILLRTALIKDGVMHVQAGAGVVADSDPDAEYAETLAKSEALRRAAEEAWRFA